MARATKTTDTPAVLEDETEATTAEQTPKQVINEGISRVLEASGIGVQHARYKAMRAIAYQAFLEAIEGDDFDGLVDRAIANVPNLPTGWELDRAHEDVTPAPAKKVATKATATPAKATTAKATATKATTKTAAAKSTGTATARKRPTR